MLQESQINETFFFTDFETLNISHLVNPEEGMCPSIIKNENIVYLRFIRKNVFEEYFNTPDSIDKSFFLPTHKEMDFFQFLKTFKDTQELNSVPDVLSDYFPDIIKQSLKEEYFIKTVTTPIVTKDNIDKVATSMFILYKDDTTFDETKIIEEKDLSDDVEKPEIVLLNSGLKVCELLPLYNRLVAYGFIRDLKNCLLSLDYRRAGHSKTDTEYVSIPPIVSDSSHVSLFKMDKARGNITFSDIAQNFKLLSTDMFSKSPRRKNKRR